MQYLIDFRFQFKIIELIKLNSVFIVVQYCQPQYVNEKAQRSSSVQRSSFTLRIHAFLTFMLQYANQIRMAFGIDKNGVNQVKLAELSKILYLNYV